MDPITALATITQLVGLFVQERRSGKDLDRETFLEWLTHHRHNELKDLIEGNHALSEQLMVVLQSDHTEIIEELRQVNASLAGIISSFRSIGPLASSLAPEENLSRFALASLCHFEDSGQKNMITLPDGSGVQFGNNGAIKHEEPRFLTDDMDALESCGFIKMTIRQPSYAGYEITRRGAEFVKQIRAEREPGEDGNG